ncbi:unnamed protein product [Pedinophyceae sp. YPF-701]|nr:unnamed protein product [Pedinophyceae sp. YPF-701]
MDKDGSADQPAVGHEVLPQRQRRRARERPAKRARRDEGPSGEHAAPSDSPAVSDVAHRIHDTRVDSPAPQGAEVRGDGPGDAAAGPSGGGEGATLRWSTLPEYRKGSVNGMNFEYLDHTADIQVHSWGKRLEEALEGAALGMFNYMSDLQFATIDPSMTREIEATGHDASSLLFGFLDELLFTFHTENLLAKRVTVTELRRGGESWAVRARVEGEAFDRTRHEIGTEVKAITYSAMQIIDEPDNAEIFVILDI